MFLPKSLVFSPTSHLLLVGIGAAWVPLSANYVLHTLDGQQNFLLVAQLDNANVLEILPSHLGYVAHRLIVLLQQGLYILLQTQQLQPFLYGSLEMRGEIRIETSLSLCFIEAS